MPHNCRIFSFYLFNRLLQALAYLTYKGQLFDKVWKYTAYNGSDGACSNSLIQSQMSAGKSSLMIQTASGKGTYTAYSAASNSESDLMAVSVWGGTPYVSVCGGASASMSCKGVSLMDI